jgi:hypothetical protein
VVPKDDERASQNIALPAQSDGSIRTLRPEERAKLVRAEERARQRPNTARLIIALAVLVIGGLTIWWANSPSPRPTPSSSR